MSKEVVCVHCYAFFRDRLQGVIIGRDAVERLAWLILNYGKPMDRSFVDCQPDDPRYGLSSWYKQICTYGVVRHKGQILSYSRVADHDRPELAQLRSIGIGGHVEPSDIGAAQSVEEVIEALYDAVGRELAEEVPGGVGATLRIVGHVNDDASSRHHIGILYVADLEDFNPGDFEVGYSEELVSPGFFSPSILSLNHMEPWSKIVLEALLQGQL